MKDQPKLSKRASLQRMRDLGIRPGTVIDVGVAMGTNGLYDVFDDVRYLLIEPLAEAAPFLRRIVELHPGSVAVQAAAGAAAGQAPFVVAPDFTGSSFLLPSSSGETRTVQIVTVDGAVAAHGLEPSYVLKLDVQGFELEVLAGAEQTLGRCDALILEASLWADRKRRGIPSLTEILPWLETRGFVLYDIAGIVRRKLDDAITELDLVFCPAASPLRTVKTYKTPEQRREMIERRRRAFGLV